MVAPFKQSRLEVTRPSGEVAPLRIPRTVSLDAPGELRKVAYVPGKGSWFVLDVFHQPGSTAVRAQVFTPTGAKWRSIDYLEHDSRLFLSFITDLSYPDGATRYGLSDAMVVRKGEFRPDGYAAESVDDKRRPPAVRTEFTNVAVDANWVDIPLSGDWGRLVHPEVLER